MEENSEELRGKQAKWHKDVKDELYANKDHITVKEIGDNAANRKKQWKEMKAMQEKSGWRVTEADNE